MLTLFQKWFPSLIFTPWFQGVFPTPLPKTDLSFLGTSDTSCENQIPVPVWVPYRFAPWGQRVPLICLLWTPSRVWLRREWREWGREGKEGKEGRMEGYRERGREGRDEGKEEGRKKLEAWTYSCSFQCGPQKGLYGVTFSTHFSNLEQTKIIMDVAGTEGSKVLFFPLPQKWQLRQGQGLSAQQLFNAYQRRWKRADPAAFHLLENKVQTPQQLVKALSLIYHYFSSISPTQITHSLFLQYSPCFYVYVPVLVLVSWAKPSWNGPSPYSLLPTSKLGVSLLPLCSYNFLLHYSIFRAFYIMTLFFFLFLNILSEPGVVWDTAARSKWLLDWSTESRAANHSKMKMDSQGSKEIKTTNSGFLPKWQDPISQELRRVPHGNQKHLHSIRHQSVPVRTSRSSHSPKLKSVLCSYFYFSKKDKFS